ncbi:hypothetical protein QOZ83_04005 [Romboutsia sedimentorum]|uniref:hypothetical protein n=1 Tax=Romboutsia sedimentorum TaxID=1368474 RepID=UPI0024DE9C3C|nr:hypothetical protein [Romboutsia sedimentorum]MDK2585014.1 hypothetical protein [Romboutsia sedimentorum]
MNYKEVSIKNNCNYYQDEVNNIDSYVNYEQIKSKERVNNHGEVLTPEWLVKDMLDLLPKSVSKIDSRYIETAAGEGAFLLEILRRKLTTVFSMYQKISDREFYTIVALCNIYGLELLKDNVEVTRTRLEMLVRDYFINQNNMSTKVIFFDIIKMILDINIINIDSMMFKAPIFDDNHHIIRDDNGEFIYKNELARISEWEFDYEKKEVKRIEYYYEDVVNKQREEYLVKNKEQLLMKKSNDVNLYEDDDDKTEETLEEVEQISFFVSSSTNIEIESEIEPNEKYKNIDKIVLKPVRVIESVNYLKFLDLK